MEEGIVTKSTGNLYTVLTKNNTYINCKVKGNFKIKGLKTSNPVAVGDKVNFDLLNEIGLIHEVKDRKNFIIRKAANWSKQWHVLAANIDQALVVVSLKDPDTPLEFIDRYLMTAHAYSIPCIIIVNKVDLITINELVEKLNSIKNIYTAIGYNVIETSVINNLNINLVSNILKNKITLVSGNSGVGKSSLINSIDPQLFLKTGIISEMHKTGKHTTSNTEMFTLSMGGYIIDSPGIRGFGVVDFNKAEMYHHFPEIFNEAKNCKYNNCLHLNEPHCAIREAVKTGKIANSRYVSYVNIYFDENAKYR